MNILWMYILMLTFSALAQAGGDSGDGHTHGEVEKPLAVIAAAPRASAGSEEFELVAVLAEKKLTLYLDRYASNTPVADAQIELESGALKLVATQIAPGVYALPGEHFARPGKYPLVFSIQTADSSDLLTTKLEIAQPAAAATKAPGQAQDQALLWGAAGALLLTGIGVVWMRRKK